LYGFEFRRREDSECGTKYSAGACVLGPSHICRIKIISVCSSSNTLFVLPCAVITLTETRNFVWLKFRCNLSYLHTTPHLIFYEKHRIIRYVTTAIINTSSSFYVLLTVHLGVILVTDHLNAQIHFL
jgi:hypothetical protein